MHFQVGMEAIRAKAEKMSGYLLLLVERQLKVVRAHVVVVVVVLVVVVEVLQVLQVLQALLRWLLLLLLPPPPPPYYYCSPSSSPPTTSTRLWPASVSPSAHAQCLLPRILQPPISPLRTLSPSTLTTHAPTPLLLPPTGIPACYFPRPHAPTYTPGARNPCHT